MEKKELKKKGVNAEKLKQEREAEYKDRVESLKKEQMHSI